MIPKFWCSTLCSSKLAIADVHVLSESIGTSIIFTDSFAAWLDYQGLAPHFYGGSSGSTEKQNQLKSRCLNLIFFKHYPVFFFSWLSLFTTTAHGNQEKLGCDSDKPVSFVFHGGSGSSLEDIRYAIEAGVVKMNIDTDTCHGQTPAGGGSCYWGNHRGLGNRK